MKKAGFWAVVLGLLAALGASAQFGIGARAGVGAAFATYQYDLGVLGKTQKQTGGITLAAHAGLAALYILPAGFEVEGGVQFGMFGGRSKSLPELGNFSISRSVYAVQVPVRLGWSVSFGQTLGAYAQVGPQFTIAVAGRETAKAEVARVVSETTTDMKFEDNAYNRFLIDLSIHAGVKISSLRVGAYYDMGLLNMSSVKGFTYRPSSAGVSLAYFFGM